MGALDAPAKLVEALVASELSYLLLRAAVWSDRLGCALVQFLA
jgi:hypothetical protein